ncbi:hypothetical protein QJS10_CPA07g01339 [Acorus calamus]|uniref:Uncharacterized protein n=1 Tax=Acorus calamus TaxID=4465 RepID=A0AAV9EKH6_ACOCL|nr:hypothetical protein QJS10_CPA07g01339 [Acorus calamus]
MNRIGRESNAGPGRRGPPVTGRRRVMAVEEVEAVDLDLFMRSRKVVPVDSADESDGLNCEYRASITPRNPARRREQPPPILDYSEEQFRGGQTNLHF